MEIIPFFLPDKRLIFLDKKKPQFSQEPDLIIEGASINCFFRVRFQPIRQLAESSTKLISKSSSRQGVTAVSKSYPPRKI